MGEAEHTADFENDPRINGWIETVVTYFKWLSYEFDNYGAETGQGPKVKGPGAYAVFPATYDISQFADSPESNPFRDLDEDQYLPADVGDYIPLEDRSEIYENIKEIADSGDQAMVFWPNGKIDDSNFRFLDPRDEEIMEKVSDQSDHSTRHQSAAETSARPQVIETVALSEEDGTVTRYRDGSKEREYERDEIVDEIEELLEEDSDED